MKVFISMGIAVLFYSLYPIIASHASEEADPYVTVFIMQFTAFFFAVAAVGLYLKKSNKLSRCIQIHKEMDANIWLNIIVAGASSAFCNLFFILALSMASKGGVSVIVEGWPILAVLMTPLMVNKAWTPIDRKDMIYGLLAIVGVAMIVLSDTNLVTRDVQNDMIGNLDSIVIFGYILAFLASYLTAIHSLTKANYSLALNQLNNSTAEVLMSEVMSRGIGAILVGIVVIVLGKTGNWSVDALITGFLIGFFVILLAGGTYTYAIMKARSPNIHIFYYLIPLMAVIWLYLAGLTEITLYLVLGGLCVVAANLAIFFKNRKAI